MKKTAKAHVAPIITAPVRAEIEIEMEAFRAEFQSRVANYYTSDARLHVMAAFDNALNNALVRYGLIQKPKIKATPKP